MRNKIKCLECGRFFTRPLSHVWQVHGIDARTYKELHGLDVSKGIATDEYKERMREHTKKHYKKVVVDNLIGRGKKTRFTPETVPRYTRSLQTQARLKEHWKRVAPLGRKSRKKEGNIIGI